MPPVDIEPGERAGGVRVHRIRCAACGHIGDWSTDIETVHADADQHECARDARAVQS